MEKLMSQEEQMGVVERLRKEKAVFCESTRELGKKAGLRDAYCLPYSELREIVIDCECASMDMRFDEKPSTYDVCSFYKTDAYQTGKAGEDVKEAITVDQCEDYHRFDEKIFIEGWLESVYDFYLEIKDKL